jgi:hypothetical protein
MDIHGLQEMQRGPETVSSFGSPGFGSKVEQFSAHSLPDPPTIPGASQ